MHEFRTPAPSSVPSSPAGSGKSGPAVRLRRTGLIGALLLGLTGALAGAVTAAPASAAETVSGSGSDARADGSHRAGPGKSGVHRGGYGKGHGKGHGGGHGRDKTVDYVAFGDSYASGYGGGPLLDACGRTAQGYPALLDALPRVELDSDQSCAGATALTTAPAPPAGPVDLPEQISTAVSANLLNRDTDLVTVTISGNDIQFGSVVAACAGTALPETCAPALAAAQAYAENTVVPQLQASFAQIRETAPRAELVVAGYPYLFEAGTPGILSTEAQNLFNAGTDALNDVVAGQVGDGTFVDVTDAFAGHGIGSADPWILNVTDPYALHPTATGYSEGYFAAITAAVDVERLGQGGKGHCRGRS
ncbi:SGNH/GDSL hydrolase family protein [Arthrobacter sp. APC 3897]|uniref:SGNH/GDSL hydrolase family protein n=1 Tax=Arthrobacter sp. APC 3897 TaxID=3035204 RepID=UPI0025B4F5E4|nr:SGNH/GDSL hydrolase family protein [Arthrobacter sp. APC 3897]MDN3481865.1 SGNH/GDSL hydrolase family protein [Arthrobacter sp. APC 3897]